MHIRIKKKGKMNKKGMDGMVILISVIIIAVVFTIFSAYAISISQRDVAFSLEDISVTRSSSFLINYLKTEANSIEVADLLKDFDKNKALIRTHTDSIIKKLGTNYVYRISVGNDYIDSSNYDHDFDLYMEDTTYIPQELGEKPIKVRIEVRKS